MYVCICKGITDNQIRDAVCSGAQSIRDLKAQLGVASQCGRCACEVRDIVKTTLDESVNPSIFYQVA